MAKNKKAQTNIQIIIAVLLIAGGLAFIKYPNLGYVLAGLGLLFEPLTKLIKGGI